MSNSFNISILNDKGIKHLELMQYDQAFADLHRAFLLLTAKNSPVHSKCEESSKICSDIRIEGQTSMTFTTRDDCDRTSDDTDIDFDEGMYFFKDPIQIPYDEPNDSEVIKASLLYNIGILNSQINENQEAELHFVKVWSIIKARRSMFSLYPTGKRSLFQGPSVPVLLYNIGLIQFQLKKYKDAVRTYTQLVNISLQEEGPRNNISLDVASALNCLGVALSYMALLPSQNKKKCLEEASWVLSKALSGRQAFFEGNCLDLETGTMINNIGRINFLLGNLNAAQKNYEEAFHIRISLLEDTHMDIAAIFYNIGQVQCCLGNVSETLSLYHRCLDIISMAFGNCHPKVTRVLVEIAEIHMKKENFNIATKYFTKALSSVLEVHDERPQEVAFLLRKLGDICHKQEHFMSALSLYNQELTVRRSHSDVPHPVIIDTLHRIANIHELQGRYALAIEVHNEILKMQQNWWHQFEETGSQQEEQHLRAVINTFSIIGLLHFYCENCIQAIAAYEKALGILHSLEEGKDLGLTHCEISIYNAIGVSYFNMKKTTLAHESFQESLRLHRGLIAQYDSYQSSSDISTILIAQDDSPQLSSDISTILYNNAVSFQLSNRLVTALEYFKEALSTAPCVSIQNAGGGEDDLQNDHACAIITNINDIYQELGEVDDGLIYFQEALKRSRNRVGNNTTNGDPTLSSVEIEVKILTCIGNLHYGMGNYQEARTALDEASLLICLLDSDDDDDDDDDYDDEDVDDDNDGNNNFFQEIVSTYLCQLASGRITKSMCAAAA